MQRIYEKQIVEIREEIRKTKEKLERLTSHEKFIHGQHMRIKKSILKRKLKK